MRVTASSLFTFHLFGLKKPLDERILRLVAVIPGKRNSSGFEMSDSGKRQSTKVKHFQLYEVMREL